MASSKSDQVCKNIEIHGSYQETVNKQRQNQKGQKLEHKDFKTAITNIIHMHKDAKNSINMRKREDRNRQS